LKALLDTHILVRWVSHPDGLSPAQRHAVGLASDVQPLLVASISLWEVATLVSLGRLCLDRPLREWLEQAVAPPLVRVVELSPSIAAEVAALPDSFHRDPADRIIVASARVHAAALLTNDRRIRESALVTTI
jgi:PIN domain nuclease of toxin-antitoxin system